ncbi:MAG: DUF2892 domain-containing protein [Proteobacteria bacterium]|nr:DUF2892 domain-containing protein [Pseudomonadota bacterium]NIS71181.1 DUF2892 domain-containing protein [Pseudomonadota bacterium]
MANTTNVSTRERGVRIVLAVILIPLGFFLAGYWKPISIVLGCFFLLTALIRY